MPAATAYAQRQGIPRSSRTGQARRRARASAKAPWSTARPARRSPAPSSRRATRRCCTDAQGHYRGRGRQRADAWSAPSGYGRATIAGERCRAPTIKLTPLRPKALYLTVYGIGAPFLRDPALEVIEKSGLNALVIDLKGDRGLIPYPSKLPLAAKIGALKLRTIPDLKELVTTLKGKGIYLIARIVVFKDDLLAAAIREWAIRTAGGALWKDREGLAWIDPFSKEAWDYHHRAWPRRPPPRASTRSSSTTSASPTRRRPRLRQGVDRERRAWRRSPTSCARRASG